MKRSSLFLFGIVCAMPALASSHLPAPEGGGIVSLALYEIEHFLIHMGMVANALSVMPSSFGMGTALLGDQSFCAPASTVASVLFGGPFVALFTFVTTLGILAFASWRTLRFVSLILGRHAYGHAFRRRYT